jgi:hypothetical protein
MLRTGKLRQDRELLPTALHLQHDMRACGPPCCGGALCGQPREGRPYVRELPGCTPSQGHVLHALGRHLQPHLADGQEKRGAGQVCIPPGSRRDTRLSHSETVCDTAWAGPDRSPPPHTHAAPVCVGARAVSRRPNPGWHETCGEKGQGVRVGWRASRVLQRRGADEVSRRET